MHPIVRKLFGSNTSKGSAANVKIWLRFYMLIELANIITSAIRLYLDIQLMKPKYYEIIMHAISIVLLIVSYLSVALAKKKVKSIIMVIWGSIIFVFYYEFHAAFDNNETLLLVDLLYICPLIRNLALKKSPKASYIVAACLMGYMLIRITISTNLKIIKYISYHIQVAYTIFLMHIAKGLMRKAVPQIHIMESQQPKYDSMLLKLILEESSLGIIKVNKQSGQIIYSNEAAKTLLSNENDMDVSPPKAISRFIYTNQILKTEGHKEYISGPKIIKVFNKMLSLSEDSMIYSLILSDSTPFEEINKQKYGMSFFSTITHELRTPLNAIEGSFYLLREYITLQGEETYNICLKAIMNLKFLIRDTLVNPLADIF